MKNSFWGILFLTMVLFPVFSEVPDQPAAEYIKNVHMFGNAETMELQLAMDISGKQGQKERELSLQMDRRDDEKILIKITAPSFLSNMKYLSVKSSGKEARWMKTSRGVRRLSAKNNSDSLFGSDFTVEDLSLTDISVYRWSYMDSSEESIIRIKAEPLYESADYAFKVLNVDDSSGVLTGIDYFNRNGDHIKQYILLEEMTGMNAGIPSRVVMKNLVKGSETVLEILSAEFDMDFPASVFNKGNL